MIEAVIYVEGVNDRTFLATYLEVVLGFQITREETKKKRSQQDYLFEQTNVCRGSIELLGGWTKLNDSYIQETIEEHLHQGKQVLVVMDADFPALQDKGGFEQRQVSIQALQEQLAFEYFLVPNHEEDGYIETLLEKIMQPAYRSVLECLQAHKACLDLAQTSLPTGKTLALPPEKKAVKTELVRLRELLRNYTIDGFKDTTIWNLHHPYLDPLKEFLTNHLTPQLS